MTTNKQLFNKLLEQGKKLIHDSFDENNYNNPSYFNPTGFETYYFTHPINYDFAGQILFLNNFVFTTESAVGNWDFSKLHSLCIGFYIEKKDVDKLKDFCDKMNYYIKIYNNCEDQLKRVNEEYIVLKDELDFVRICDNQRDRKTLYLELGLFFNEINNNLYDIDDPWLKRDFYDKLVEKLLLNDYVKKSHDLYLKLVDLNINVIHHTIFSTNRFIAIIYDSNKINDLRQQLDNKYIIDEYIDENLKDVYYIRNNIYNNKDHNWHIFYEDLYNIFKLQGAEFQP